MAFLPAYVVKKNSIARTEYNTRRDASPQSVRGDQCRSMQTWNILTDYWDGVTLSVADAGGPLYLYADVRLSIHLCGDVTHHVPADDCHVGGETAKPDD